MNSETGGSPLLENIQSRARLLRRHVVLPEVSDPRVLEAAAILAGNGLARVSLIGDGGTGGGIPEGIEWVDPRDPHLCGPLAARLLELRRDKGMTEGEARQLATDPLFTAGWMVATGRADAAVGGSIATTASVIRAGLQTIGTGPGGRLVSGFFLMELVDGRALSFADCAVIPQPDATQLAGIAVTTAGNHRRLTGELPRVAMLSFSTRGSAAHPDVDKVREATRLVKIMQPDLLVDGELQFDAAFDPGIGERKAAGSSVAGRANVCVFPDLDAGNIGYKIAQRIGGARAIGPLIQGLRAPFMDLSRGCSVNDIVQVACVAAVMAADRD